MNSVNFSIRARPSPSNTNVNSRDRQDLSVNLNVPLLDILPDVGKRLAAAVVFTIGNEKQDLCGICRIVQLVESEVHSVVQSRALFRRTGNIKQRYPTLETGRTDGSPLTLPTFRPILFDIR